MKPTFDQVYEQALALTPKKRLELAKMIYENLPLFDNAEIDAAWEKEIKRRIGEIQQGKAKLVPAEEVHRRLAAARAKHLTKRKKHREAV